MHRETKYTPAGGSPFGRVTWRTTPAGVALDFSEDPYTATVKNSDGGTQEVQRGKRIYTMYFDRGQAVAAIEALRDWSHAKKLSKTPTEEPE